MSDESKPFLIYGLFHPKTFELRYIGKTECSLKKRLREHLCLAWSVDDAGKWKKGLYVYNWIRSLGREVRPEIDLLESFSDRAEFIEAECWNIEYYRSIGCRLTNLTDGGEGAWGYRHTPEALEKMSRAKRGRVSNRKGKPHSIETRLKVSQTKSGLTNEQQQRIAGDYQAGDSSYVVAERYGVSATCVMTLVDIFGFKRRTGTTNNKLTPSQIDDAVFRYSLGENTPLLGARFGVHDRTVARALRSRGVELRSGSGRLYNMRTV